MIKTHLTSFVLTILVLIAFTVPLTAFAGELVVIVEGARSLTYGTHTTDTINFGSTTASAQDQVLPDVGFDTTGMVIDDMESGVASWSVTMSATEFTSGGTDTIPYSNLSIIGDDDATIEVTDGTSNTDGITYLENYTAFSGSGDPSDDITIISADSRDRTAEYTIHPQMQLSIPGGTVPDTYSNTLTITFLVN